MSIPFISLNIDRVKRIFGLLRTEYGAYAFSIVALGMFSFLGGVLEGFGITAIIPLLSFLYVGDLRTSSDLVSQFIEVFFTFFSIPFTLKFLVFFILIIFILKSILLFFAKYISAYVTTNYERTTRNELFKLMLKSDWVSLSEQGVGYLNQILSVDVVKSSNMLMYISISLITITNLFVYTFIVFNVSMVVALFTVFFATLIFLFLKPLLYKSKILSQEVSNLYKITAHFVDEVVIGMKAIKSIGLENSIIRRGKESFDRMCSLNMLVIVLRDITNVFLQPLGLVLVVGIFTYLYKTASFGLGSFVVIIYAINKIFTNVQILQLQLYTMSSLEPYVDVIRRYKLGASKSNEENIGVQPFSFNEKFEMKNIHFVYNKNGFTLNDFNFSIKKGEMIGIVGPSGSGKTTVADLILRLYPCSLGSILVDGVCSDQIRLNEWRDNIGYVSQDSFLISDTIENNLKFYRKEIKQEDMISATKMAHIYEFIDALPDKFNTVVGERGIGLSMGERQRILLARVLITKPSILILDEATSALDKEAEASIQSVIANLRKNMAIIIIAHRISTVMDTDHIIVLSKGSIIEEGDPGTLIKDKTSYLYKVSNFIF